MWELAGTLCVAAFGGTLLIHYLRNFFLAEKLPLAWDWDGLLERAVIAYLMIAAPEWRYFIPVVVLIKTIVRLAGLALTANISKVKEPGAVYQKVTIKAELAMELLVSPAFAILVGVVF
jgi:hypothetical protein